MSNRTYSDFQDYAENYGAQSIFTRLTMRFDSFRNDHTHKESVDKLSGLQPLNIPYSREY